MQIPELFYYDFFVYLLYWFRLSFYADPLHTFRRQRTARWAKAKLGLKVHSANATQFVASEIATLIIEPLELKMLLRNLNLGLCFLISRSWPIFHLFSFFLSNIYTIKIEDLSWIWTGTVRLEGEPADHLTTITVLVGICLTYFWGGWLKPDSNSEPILSSASFSHIWNLMGKLSAGFELEPSELKYGELHLN